MGTDLEPDPCRHSGRTSGADLAALFEMRTSPGSHDGSDRSLDPRPPVRAALLLVESKAIAVPHARLPERQLLHVGEWRDGVADDLDGSDDPEAASAVAEGWGVSAGVLRGGLRAASRAWVFISLGVWKPLQCLLSLHGACEISISIN